MDTTSGVIIQPLLSHSILYSSSTLYVFNESDLTSCSQHPFALFNTSIFVTYKNYLLCQPDRNHITIYEFDINNIEAAPAVHSTYLVPSNYKISVASWANYSEPDQVYALLGTRDGTILRLDINQPELTPLSLNNSIPSPHTQQTPSTPSFSFTSYADSAQTPICDSYLSPTSVSSSPVSPPLPPSTPIIATNLATVSSIASAPCGLATYAIGYAAGHISIIQLTSLSTFREIHKIQPMGSPRKISALAWHYSSDNPASQSLAALRHGSGKAIIWTIDILDNTASYKKIREVHLPISQDIPTLSCIGNSSSSSGSRFLQWSKTGKLIRVSSAGLLVSDVRTKKVSTKTISLPGSITAVLVHSNRGKALVLTSEGLFYTCNLLEADAVDSPSSVSLELAAGSTFELDDAEDDATILESPVVFLHPVKVGQVTQVTIKRATGFKKDSEISFSMMPVKAISHSLFPFVLKNLAKMSPQKVPQFLPSQLSLEKYIVCALFGAAFDPTTCLMGMKEVLQHSITNFSETRSAGLSPELRQSVLKLLLYKDLSHSVLSDIIQQVDSLPKPLLSALLSCKIPGDNAESVVPLFQSALKESDNLAHLHLSCAFLYANSRAHDAQQLYLQSHLYIEAVIISLLDSTLDVVSVLKTWRLFIDTTSPSNTGFLMYLTDLIINIESGLGSSFAFPTENSDTITNNQDSFNFTPAISNPRRNLSLSSATPGTINSFSVTVPSKQSIYLTPNTTGASDSSTDDSPDSSISAFFSPLSDNSAYTPLQQQFSLKPPIPHHSHSRSAGSRSDNYTFPRDFPPQCPETPVSYTSHAFNVFTPISATFSRSGSIDDSASTVSAITTETPMSPPHSISSPKQNQHNPHFDHFNPNQPIYIAGSTATSAPPVTNTINTANHMKNRSASPNFAKSVYASPPISDHFF